MKKIMMIVLLCLSSVFAFAETEAQDFQLPGSEFESLQRNIQCQARDRGWEEHFGGHRTCGECLRRHGNCVQTCSRDYFVCHAVGYGRNGRRVTTEGRALNRFRAANMALRSCSYYGYRNCRISRCVENSETLFRRLCRRR